MIASIARIPVERVALAVLPFVAILALDIMLFVLFPQIATALPALFR